MLSSSMTQIGFDYGPLPSLKLHVYSLIYKNNKIIFEYRGRMSHLWSSRPSGNRLGYYCSMNHYVAMTMM